jgi:hypothetical protein
LESVAEHKFHIVHSSESRSWESLSWSETKRRDVLNCVSVKIDHAPDEIERSSGDLLGRDGGFLSSHRQYSLAIGRQREPDWPLIIFDDRITRRFGVSASLIPSLFQFRSKIWPSAHLSDTAVGDRCSIVLDLDFCENGEAAIVRSGTILADGFYLVRKNPWALTFMERIDCGVGLSFSFAVSERGVDRGDYGGTSSSKRKKASKPVEAFLMSPKTGLFGAVSFLIGIPAFAYGMLRNSLISTILGAPLIFTGRMTWTALPITSAGRFSPLGPRGISRSVLASRRSLI